MLIVYTLKSTEYSDPNKSFFVDEDEIFIPPQPKYLLRHSIIKKVNKRKSRGIKKTSKEIIGNGYQTEQLQKKKLLKERKRKTKQMAFLMRLESIYATKNKMYIERKKIEFI